MTIRILLSGLLLFLVTMSNAYAADRRSAIVDAVAKARDAVVNIRTEQVVKQRNNSIFGFSDSFFEQFFSDMFPPRSYNTQSLGSGVIINSDGYVLTNAHVVDKASRIFVALSEQNKELEAKLIGKDNRLDLAVLKIDQQKTFPFLSPGRSNDLLLGETVIAIGNPLGLGHSITTGVISSARRRIQIDQGYLTYFIQSDALINPGNSGGPLININGELIGINTAIAQQAQGIGFSIPIDTARRVLKDLIEYGLVRRAFLGIVPAEVGEAFTRSHGDGGVLVEDLLPAAPAIRDGVKLADVVLAIDGVPLSSVEHFYSTLRTYTPDDNLQLTLLRGLQKVEKTVKLEPLPNGYLMAYTRRAFGFTLQQGQRNLLIDEVVTGSLAKEVGMQPGDRIAEIDGIEVHDLNDFENVMAEHLGRLPLPFVVVRGNRAYLVRLP